VVHDLGVFFFDVDGNAKIVSEYGDRVMLTWWRIKGIRREMWYGCEVTQLTDLFLCVCRCEYGT
jgi:hypothetical protein